VDQRQGERGLPERAAQGDGEAARGFVQPVSVVDQQQQGLRARSRAISTARSTKASRRPVIRAHPSPADADAHALDRHARDAAGHFGRTQLQRRGHGARIVVVVGRRRADGRVEVAALVADDDLQQRALIAVKRALDVGVCRRL